MSFRRNSDATQSWKKWLARHRDALLACGMPLAVLENKRHWDYFLEHGYFTLPGIAEPIINIDWMDRKNLELLCTILEGSYGAARCTILNELHNRSEQRKTR